MSKVLDGHELTGAEMMRDLIRTMVDSGARHAELSLTFDDSTACLHVTLVSLEPLAQQVVPAGARH